MTKADFWIEFSFLLTLVVITYKTDEKINITIGHLFLLLLTSKRCDVINSAKWDYLFNNYCYTWGINWCKTIWSSSLQERSNISNKTLQLGMQNILYFCTGRSVKINAWEQHVKCIPPPPVQIVFFKNIKIWFVIYYP